MIVNTWKLLGEISQRLSANYPPHKLSKAIGVYNVAKSAPFGTFDNPTDYSTHLRPKD